MLESEITHDPNAVRRANTLRTNASRFYAFRYCALILIGLLVPIGCSKEERDKIKTTFQEQTQNIAEKTQQYTQAAFEAVEEKLPAAGRISLRMDPPIEFDSATAQVVSLGPGRGNVVQISNYELGAGPKTYPSLLIQGATDAETVAALAGQTINCDFYMRASYSDPVLMNASGRPVQINFTKFDVGSNTISASIYSGALISSDDRQVNLNGGKVVALIKGGN